MTSPSRLSRESTTRSSVFPQNGQRMTRRISRSVGSWQWTEAARSSANGQLSTVNFVRCLAHDVLPTQPFPRKQHESRQNDRQGSHGVKQKRYSYGRVD